MENILYYGDNLEILRKYIKDETIDLIYLDPPFNSNADYNVLFKEVSETPMGGGAEKSKAQIQAFTDSWTWDAEAQRQFEYLNTNKAVPAKITYLIMALERLLGKNSMTAYLVMMTVRLIEMRRVLKPTGSIYLHCDPTASHYLRMVLDAVFGEDNFQNEIIWHYGGPSAVKKGFPRKHDTLLFYSKSLNFDFNPQFGDIENSYVMKRVREDPDGRRWVDQNLGKLTEETIKRMELEGRIFTTSTGRLRRKQYIDEMKGEQLTDVWDIDIINSQSKERLGYPTQKPTSLLERVVKASSRDGDIILDPFCGCGTTIDAVEKVNLETQSHREWIGIDITHLAINLIKRRIHDKYPNTTFDVIGEPKDYEGAKQLAENDRYQFEWWALSLIDARPINDKKKGSDKGIDGIIYVSDPRDKSTKTVLVQVKSGHVKSGDIRDLKGTLEREKARFGVFLTLEEPTKEMKEEAITYGFEESPLSREQIPKIQILTIKEVLEGVKPKILFVNVSYKKAEKHKPKKSKKVIIKKVGRYKKLG